MVLLSSFGRIYALILPAILLFQAGDNTAPYRVSQQALVSTEALPVSLVIWTDRANYSLRDAMKVNGALQNNGHGPWYIDRRIAWTGGAGGLQLEIRNEQGKILPASYLSDVLMPPPPEGDKSFFILLEPGFLYGSYMHLKVKDFFPKPGRYSLRVTYKSWLIKETVAPQLRNLPALWVDSPEIISEPVWIEVTSPAKRVRR
ncbi:MAG: hypothetical protein H7Z16_08015 [Pyrinomonadaceae bacterium]|nr:hypothetical protein [Pyrinomonadaceae bacterium]